MPHKDEFAEFAEVGPGAAAARGGVAAASEFAEFDFVSEGDLPFSAARTAEFLPERFNRGLASFIDAPFDFLVDTAASLTEKGIPFPTTPELAAAGGPSEIRLKPFEAAGIELPFTGEDIRETFPPGQTRALLERGGQISEGIEGPRGPLERVLATGVEVTGENILPVGGIQSALLRRAGRLTPGITSPDPSRGLASNALDTLARNVARAPAATTGAEVASSFGAGGGIGVAEEIAPGSPGAALTGAILGGFSPLVVTRGPLAQAFRLTRNVKTRFSPAAIDKGARRLIGEGIGEELTPEITANLQQSVAAGRALGPEFKPSVAAQTGSQELRAAQADVEARMTPAAREMQRVRRAANERVVADFADINAPQSSGEDIAFVLGAAQGDVKALTLRIGAAETAVAGRQATLAARIPEADRAARGESLRDAFSVARKTRSDEMTALATELGINDADVGVQFGPTARRMVDELEAGGIFADKQNVPDVVADIRKAIPRTQTVDTGLVDDAGNAITRQVSTAPEINFQDLKTLRERVTDDLLDSIRGANPSRKKTRALMTLKKGVDEAVLNLTFAEDPTLAQKYELFRTTYFNEFVNVFEKGIAFKTLQKGQRGFFQTIDEKVVSEIIKPGSVSAARQARAIFGDDPDAINDIAAVVLDDMRSAVVKNGVVNETALANFIAKRASVLAEFPQIKNGVDTFEAATKSLTARAATLDARRKVVEQNVLARSLMTFGRGGKTPEAVMKQLMNDPRLMGQFQNRIRGDVAAQNALKRNLWNGVTQSSAANMTNFLNDGEVVLRQVLGDKHFNNLRVINRGMRVIEGEPPLPGRGIETDPLAAVKGFLGVNAPQLASRIYQINAGFIGKNYIAADLFGRFFANRALRQTDAVFTEALYDADIAEQLAQITFVRNQLPAFKTNKLNVFLANIGFDPVGEESRAQ